MITVGRGLREPRPGGRGLRKRGKEDPEERRWEKTAEAPENCHRPRLLSAYFEKGQREKKEKQGREKK